MRPTTFKAFQELNRKLVRSFNSSFHYVDEQFGGYLHRIYPNYLEIKDTTDSHNSATYLEIDNGGRLETKLYDKRDDFTFPIVTFPFISSNIPASPVYAVYISQFMLF